MICYAYAVSQPWITDINLQEEKNMRKKVIQWILQRIVKNAERSAGLPSDHGLFEAPVPEKLMNTAKKK